MEIKPIHIILFLFAFGAQAQERNLVKGRVHSSGYGINDVLVVNLNAEAETRTDSIGNFRLNAKIGDLFVISDHRIETLKVRYTPDMVKNGVLTLNVTMAVTEIEEIAITRSNITSQSLGIPMGKKYTASERHLKTAGDFKPVHLLGILGGSLPIDPIINAVNGRTKRIKKEITIERKELALKKLDALFTEDYFTERLKVPDDYVAGFKSFSIDNENFLQVLNEGHKEKIEMSLADLAVQYRNLAQYDK